MRIHLRIAFPFVVAGFVCVTTAFASCGPSATALRAGLVSEQTPTAPADSAELLRSFRTVYIDSDTIYMKAGVMQKALERRPEFSAWGLASTSDPQAADVTLEITRPLLTFDWKYKMVHRNTGVVLGSGKVVAWEGKKAARRLAAEIVKQIRTARLPPALPQPGAETAPAGVAQERVAAKSWRVRFQSGGEGIRRGTKLRLNVSEDKIVAERKKRVVFTIPVSSVLEVVHNTKLKDPAKDWYSFWERFPPETAYEAAKSGEEAAAALILGLVVWGVGELLEETKKTQHFITIYWQEDGAVRHLALKVSARKHKALLGELKSVTRKEWKSLPELTKGKWHELERESINRIPVQLEQTVVVGWKKLPAGLYQLVLLEREPPLSELYFFAGEEVNADQVMARAVVEVESKTTGAGEFWLPAQVIYLEENGLITIREVRTPDRILRFTPVPLAPTE